MKRYLLYFFLVGQISVSTYAAESEADIKLAPPSESEIAIQISDKATVQSHESSLSTRYFFGLGLVGLLALAGFVLVKKSKQLSPRKFSPFKMKVVNNLSLGPKRSLAVVEVAGEHVLIGVTDHHISMIKSIAILDEDLDMRDENNFSKIAAQVGEKKENKFADFTEDEFSISQVKSLVKEKIKSMRPL